MARLSMILGLPLLFLTNDAMAEAPTAISTAEMEEIFAWLDRLPLANVEGLKYVRIWTGVRTSSNGDEEWKRESTEGFLISDNGKTFRVVLRDWNIVDYTKAGTETGNESYVGFRELSLPHELTTLIPKLGSQEEADSWERGFSSYYDRLSRTGQLMLLAREAAGRGYEDLALQLVQKLPAWRTVMSNSREHEPLLENLHDDFAGLLLWQALRSFDDLGNSRPKLLARFKAISELCQRGANDLERVQKMIEILERMIKEDAAHPKVDQPRLASMLPRERARELVFRLRDLSLKSKPEAEDWPDEDIARSEPDNGTAEALKQLGLDAVPALIEGMDDLSFTRTVSTSVRYGGGGWVRTVSDLSFQILTEVSGLNFYWLVSSTPQKERDKAMREALEAWWQEVEQKGEKQTLLERLHRGGENTKYYAETLLKRYPEVASEALLQEIRAVHPQAAELIALLSTNDTPEVRTLLLEIVQKSTNREQQIKAALVLRQFGESNVEKLIIKQWNALTSEELVEAETVENANPGGDFANASPPRPEPSVLMLSEFLLLSSDPAAIRAIARRLPEFSGAALLEILQGGSWARMNHATISMPALDSELGAALADLFLSAARLRLSLPAHESKIAQRLADLAGRSLADFWPEAFPFDAEASPRARDRQLIAFQNIRNKQLGEPEMPLPESPVPVPPEKAASIVAVEWAADSLQPSPELKERIEAVKGRKLDSATMTLLISELLRRPVAGVNRFELSTWRFNDLTGVTVQLGLKAGRLNASHQANQTWVQVGKYSDQDSESATQLQEFIQPQYWKKLQEGLARLKDAPPTEEFSITIAIGDE